MKLSIVIVNWNVRELLRKCLKSIEKYSFDTSEIIVVDNASNDGSADMVRENFSEVNYIKNTENRGFAAACNQGIKVAQGTYILFLNPDTQLQEESLAILTAFLDAHPNAGVVAPQLINTDGSIQPSVRKFPTIVSALRSFFHLPQRKDESFSETTEVEQPMGACLLVRRSVLETVGFFDEQFFLWFEEVDLCKRIYSAGYTLFYLPTAKVTHVGGTSFKQKKTGEKQKIFYTSFTYYLKKHLGWKAFIPRTMMQGYTIALSHPYTVIPCVGLLLVELFSYVGYHIPLVKSIGFLSVVMLTLFLSIRNLSYGILIAVGELVVGSKGYLFSFPLGTSEISVRIGIFCAIFIAWFFLILRRKGKDMFLFFQSPFLGWYLLLFLFVVWGMVQGVLQHNELGNIVRDANAWFYFFLIVPFADAIRTRKGIDQILEVATSVLWIQTIKVMFFFYVMTHQSFGADVIYPLYRWLRTTGVGEVTQFEWGGVRIFFQSQIYVIIALCMFFPWVWNFFKMREGGKRSIYQLWHTARTYCVICIGCIASIAVSFSRSFWAAMSGILLFLSLFTVRSPAAMFRTGATLALAKICALLFLGMIAFFPFPNATGGFGLETFTKRLEDLNSEAAAASRWNLLPLLENTIKQHPFMGYGFGKTVTYTSYDPRVRELNTAGTFTTFTFEWGYLDFIVKMGVGGLIAYCILLVMLFRSGLRISREHPTERVFISGLLLGLGVLMLIHVLTPYLNHPLGIAYIIFLSCVLDVVGGASSRVRG